MRDVILSMISLSVLFYLSPANAALITSVSFTEPTGTVTPDEIVEVWVTLKVDEASDPLYFNHLNPPTFDLDSSDIPTQASRFDFSSPFSTSVSFNEWETLRIGSSSTISHPTRGDNWFVTKGNYESLSFSDHKREDTLFWQTSYSTNPFRGSPNETFQILPGQSRDFLVVAYGPRAGGANIGTFELYDVELEFRFQAFDEENNISYVADGVSLGSACGSQSTECSFSRAVVPLPAAFWFLGGGLLSLLGFLNRKT